METLASEIPQINRQELPTESSSNLGTSEPSPVGAIPYIFNLDHDILLHIFHLNTLAPETENCDHFPILTTQCPINSTWYASQVCRFWRRILLGSPAIWGSLVDTRILESGSGIWAEEVIKRTGESDLSIYGWVGVTPRSRAFFTSLLTDQWHRVRRLDVIVIDPLWMSSQTWDILFTRPAPTLEKFLIRSSDRTPVFPPTNIRRPMFANCAPALCRFHCMIIEVEYNTAWLGQLSSLTLSFPVNTMEVLGILRTAVRLESLVIDLSISDPEEDAKSRWSNPISLPHLHRLYISGSTTKSLFYLQRILSHQDCALLLQITDDAVNTSTEELEQIASAVKPYTARFFDIHRPRDLFLYVGHFTFHIGCKLKTDMEYFANREIRLRFQFMNPIHLHQPITLSLNPLLSILASPSLPLSSITDLHLNNERESQWIDGDDANFITFITSLTSVTKLNLCQYTFTLINDIPLHPSLIFPNLKDVHLDSGMTLITSLPRELLLFLGRRKAAGLAVETLNLRRFVGFQQGHNWGFLDEVDGLHVVVRHKASEERYICGSGEGKHRLIWT